MKVIYLNCRVERCTGIAEVMGSNPVQAWIFFFRPYFHYCSSSAHYCEDHFHSRPEFFSGLIVTAAEVVHITTRITFIHAFIRSSNITHGFIWNQHNDPLPVGLLAQLVERCPGIAEVMGSNPVHERAAMDFGIIIYIRSDTVMISMNFNSYANLVIFFIISVLFCFVFEHWTLYTIRVLAVFDFYYRT